MLTKGGDRPQGTLFEVSRREEVVQIWPLGSGPLQLSGESEQGNCLGKHGSCGRGTERSLATFLSPNLRR